MGSATYEIVVRGRLSDSLARWFEDLDVRPSEPGDTCLRGWFADQCALQSTLTQLNELGLELSSVRRLPDDAV